ncbi:hypothetical protein SDRG_14590 [Saprolegnia diclina VS20]|uniref:ABC transporter domain-containing protein n=1 Tax=Saprolegnia diclina (strain VS20) TaxID=1156394 RepID=T0Q2C5_SAPDV|nr:hypothetical protein SDRG_14590 [Saprolegnia diclina VS20]EQC27530.1 hypothetical protein SDRG_14590 [Saprolegnia diclina VS20]|eukprot:XP_008618950.1 hypothetical protein SDRG_14590 [Saprolegnia diclina VS20]
MDTRRTCYVMQDDLFYHTLTVKEHLLFQAQLRMDPDANHAARVADVLALMGLSDCQDCYIGNAATRGISGGERKRLSLASELLTNPSILFVDEPTSGLDSVTAESVVQELQQLAARGHTVLATMHQPSSQIFRRFDALYLLSHGQLVYAGQAAAAVDYFGSIGVHCPAYMNPADFFMQEIARVDHLAHLVASWRAVATSGSPTPTNMTALDAPSRPAPHRRAGLYQWSVLCRRNLRRLVRDTAAFKARLAQSVVLALLSGLIYRNLSLSQTGIQSFAGALFFITLNQGMLAATSEFVQIPLELPLLRREVSAGLYAPTTWYLAKNVSELWTQVLFPLLFVVPVFFLIGFDAHVEEPASVLWTMSLFLSLVTSACVGLGYVISCAVPRPDVAPMVGIVALMPLVLFGGLLVNANDTPGYFVWLEYLSPIQYGYRGLNRAFWTAVPHIPCATGQRCAALSGADVLENAALDGHSLQYDVGLLLAINVGFRCLGLLALRLSLRNRRH